MFRRLFRRYYAFRYDSLICPAERAGLADWRHDLLRRATGRTIEIGAATGLNIRHLPAAVNDLVLADPDRHMLRQLVRRTARVWPQARALYAVAEHLPFADSTFETAVVIFTLCCVRDQRQALKEIARVLAPGGQMLFIEHVRSADPDIMARQDKIPFPYSYIGCHPNRDTLARIRSSPLVVESVRTGDVPMAPEIERPMITGVARKPVAVASV